MRDRPLGGGRFRTGFLLTALVCLLLGARARPAGAQALAPPDTVQAVNVVGTSSVDPDLVRRAFGITVGSRYSTDAIRRGIRRLYDLGFFRDIVVEGERHGAGVALTLRVEENPRVAQVEYAGNDKIKKDKLTEATGTLVGRMADDRLLARVERRVTEAYQKKGYTRVTVRPRFLPGDSDSRRILLVEVDEGPKVRVEKVVFQGIRQMDPGKLKGAMEQGTTGFLKGGVYHPDVLEEDMPRIEEEMAKHGFKNGKVEGYEILPGSKDDRIVVEIRVDEGQRFYVGGVSWEGNSALPAGALYGLTEVESGKVYNQEKISKTLEAAYGAYADVGYIYLSIQPDYATRDSTVDVTFRVLEGDPSKIRDLVIKGNTRTKEKVIRRQIALRPGDRFRRNLLIRSSRELMQLGYFSNIVPDTRPVPDSRDIDLILTVEERQVGTASAGFGFSSAVGLTGFMELGHTNLFGNGQSLSLRLERGSQRNNAELSFTEPWFLGTPTSVGIDLFSTNRIYNDPTLDLEIKRAGGAIRVGRPLPIPYTRIYGSYRLSNQSVSEDRKVTGVSSDGELTRRLYQTGFQINQESALTSSFALTLVRNSTDHPIYPTVGSNSRLRIELTGGPVGGDLVFQKYELDVSRYLPTFKLGDWGPTLMLRSRLGAVGETFRDKPIVPDGYVVDESIPEGADSDTLDIELGGRSPVPIPRHLRRFSQETNELFRMGGTTINALRGYEDFEIVPPGNMIRRFLVSEYSRKDPADSTRTLKDYVVGSDLLAYPGGRYMFAFTGELQFPIAEPLHGLFLFDVGGTWNDLNQFRWNSLHKGAGLGLRMEVPLLGLIGFDYAYGFDRLDRDTGRYTSSGWEPHVQFGRIF